jgi:hypothetical protein
MLQLPNGLGEVKVKSCLLQNMTFQTMLLYTSPIISAGEKMFN